MNPIFAKLNYKAQSKIAVINAPDTFLSAVDEMRLMATILTYPSGIKDISFAIAFVKTQEDVNALSHSLDKELMGDGILWMAYPKGSSKKHTCDFNRDTGWAVLGKLGFEGVRQVAIDEDWSALRFRRVEYIRKITRQDSRAMTERGKAKSQSETL